MPHSPPIQLNLSAEWPILVKFIQRLAKTLTRLAQTKRLLVQGSLCCGDRGRGRERGGSEGVSEWGVGGRWGSCRQALCVFAHTLMAEMTPSLQGPQHACAISEFHTPAPPLWAQLLLQYSSATQRTQPQLVYGPLLSQIKWSPHIKVNSLWNSTHKHKRPNGYHPLLFRWEE